MRSAVATRLRTRRLLVKSTLPPLIFLSGQSPKDAVELCPEVKHLWLIPALLIMSSFGPCRRRLLGSDCRLQFAHMEFNLLVYFDNKLLVITKRSE